MQDTWILNLHPVPLYTFNPSYVVVVLKSFVYLFRLLTRRFLHARTLLSFKWCHSTQLASVVSVHCRRRLPSPNACPQHVPSFHRAVFVIFHLFCCYCWCCLYPFPFFFSPPFSGILKKKDAGSSEQQQQQYCVLRAVCCCWQVERPASRRVFIVTNLLCPWKR